MTMGVLKHASVSALVLGVLVPNFALASKSKDCEMAAKAAYQKQNVEVAMASIVGNMSEIEVTSEKESLRKRLEKEKAHCLHGSRTIAEAKDETTGTL